MSTDIHGRSRSARQVYVLAAALQRGDSGGPVVNRQGKVVGMAFAVDTTRPHTAYALGNDEVQRALHRKPTGVVSTRGCLRCTRGCLR